MLIPPNNLFHLAYILLMYLTYRRYYCMESITEAILRYQETDEGYEKIVERVSLIIYNYPEKIHILSEEDKCDFYLSFYNRIGGLINNFTYKGYPFETLLSQTLKWHSRTYLSRKKNEKQLMAMEINEEEVKIRNLLSGDNEPRFIEKVKVDIKSNASKKRLLFLVLMDSANISDNEMLAFSEMTGFEYKWLLYLKDNLNEKLFRRSGRLNELREKRNNYFTKRRYKQIQLSEETDREKREILKDQISRLKKRLDDTRHEISRVPVRPTHSEIAELLNVPKGTVDSGLHYFRKKYKLNQGEINYSLIL